MEATGLGADDFSHEPLQRWGDVFPIPLPVDGGFGGSEASLSSRRSRQRVHKRRTLVDRARGTAWALNMLAGYEDSSSWPRAPLNRAQAAVNSRILAAHRARPPPGVQQSPQAALRQLLSRKAGSGYDLDQPGCLASYDRARLSLPRDQHEPVLLEEILPLRERVMLRNFEAEMMLGDEERGAVIERGFHRDCFVDPVLEGDANQYHQFVSDLYRCHLVGFTTKPKVQVGVFVVTKKAGRQRLIVDARRTNKLFRTPPLTLLGSSDCWSRVELDQDMFVAQEDVKDFFYRLRIDRHLGEYFALPPIDVELLRRELDYVPEVLSGMDAEATVHPYLRVLPMGFSWAFHLAHQAHVELATRTLPQSVQVRDRHAAPVMGSGFGRCESAMLIYADNANHLGISRDQVDREQREMREALHGRGLETHDVQEGSNLCESLGVRVDGLGGSVRVTAGRDHRLDRALQACSTRPAMTGEELEMIVGHITIRGLLHRGLLSVLRYCYIFIRESYHTRQALWRSVARELEMFRCLMPLGVADLRAPWCPDIYCTDASLSGYAVYGRELAFDEVREIGREDERWRFYRGPVIAPRAAALGDELEDPLTVKPEIEGEQFGDWELNETFPEVPKSVLDDRVWHKLWNAPIYHKEPIHVLEGRSILGAVKHACRDNRKHGSRILVLNDNMGVVLAAQKGRCSAYPLLRILRRVAAHSLGCGVRVYARWVASELNVADHASREWEVKRKEGEGKAANSHLQQRGGRDSKSSLSQPAFGRSAGAEETKQVPVTVAAESEKAGSTTRPWATPVGEVSGVQEEESSGATKAFRQTVEGYQGAAVTSGNPQRNNTDPKGLRQQAGQVLGLRPVLRAPGERREGARRSLVRLRRRVVPEWRELQLRPEVAGSAGVRPAGDGPRGQPQAATFSEGAQRMEAFGSTADALADDRIHQGLDFWSRFRPTPGQARP